MFGIRTPIKTSLRRIVPLRLLMDEPPNVRIICHSSGAYMFIGAAGNTPGSGGGRVARGLPGISPRSWRPKGVTLVLTGAIVLVLQNALLLAGFFVWLGDQESGFRLGSAFLFLDVPGAALLGLGILRIAAETESLGRRARLGALSGLLVLAWAGLTVLWRWALPAVGGKDFTTVFDAILGSEGGIPPELAGQAFLVRVMLLLWIATATLFAAAVLILRLRSGKVVGDALLERRVDVQSWEGFAILNAVGTWLVAGELLSILDGGSGGGLLTAGIAIKVVVVPFEGIFAYGFLAYRARRATRADGVHKESNVRILRTPGRRQ
jgi:hypothetical protein